MSKLGRLVLTRRVHSEVEQLKFSSTATLSKNSGMSGSGSNFGAGNSAAKTRRHRGVILVACWRRLCWESASALHWTTSRSTPRTGPVVARHSRACPNAARPCLSATRGGARHQTPSHRAGAWRDRGTGAQAVPLLSTLTDLLGIVLLCGISAGMLNTGGSVNKIHGSGNKIHVLRTEIRRRVFFVCKSLKNETPFVFSVLGSPPCCSDAHTHGKHRRTGVLNDAQPAKQHDSSVLKRICSRGHLCSGAVRTSAKMTE